MRSEEDDVDADIDEDSFSTTFFRAILDHMRRGLDNIRRGQRSGRRFELCRSSFTRTSCSCISDDGRWLCVNAKVLDPGERAFVLLVLVVVENPWVAAIHSSKNWIERFILYDDMIDKRSMIYQSSRQVWKQFLEANAHAYSYSGPNFDLLEERK